MLSAPPPLPPSAGLRRRLLYTKAQKDENGCAQLYRYASDQSGSFASLDGSLVSVSMHQVSVLDETGKTVYEQTVKFHRARIMERMQAHTVAELMHLAASAGFAGDLPTP